jgi:HAD superfamily hydrolase (TIGR01509 family)
MNPPPSFDAILFDLDGTLADSARDIATAIERALVRVELPVPAGLLALVDGSPLEEIFSAAAPGAPQGLYPRFAQAYRSEYDAHRHQGTTLFPGVRDTLDALGALRPRVRLAVATTKRDAVARELLELLDAAHFFDVIAGTAGTTMAHKPSPDLLLHVCRSLDVSPSRALMVGDTLRDVLAGQRAGMKTAAVTFGMGDTDELLAARPDFVLEEFDELLVVLGLAG